MTDTRLPLVVHFSQVIRPLSTNWTHIRLRRLLHLMGPPCSSSGPHYRPDWSQTVMPTHCRPLWGLQVGSALRWSTTLLQMCSFVSSIYLFWCSLCCRQHWPTAGFWWTEAWVTPGSAGVYVPQYSGFSLEALSSVTLPPAGSLSQRAENGENTPDAPSSLL